MNVEGFSYRSESLISRPEQRGRGDKDSRDQMGIRKANSQAEQPAQFDHPPDFVKLRNADRWQQIERTERLPTLGKDAQRKFRDDERMYNDLAEA